MSISLQVLIDNTYTYTSTNTHIQRLAAEFLAHACAGNSKCQDEAGSCSAPRDLIEMLKIRKKPTGAGCNAATSALLAVTDHHPRNCLQVVTGLCV